MLGWGQLPAVKVGSRQMVPEDAVVQFIRDASAANIGAQAALRLIGALIAAGWQPPGGDQ
jgi:hypothetical protein